MQIQSERCWVLYWARILIFNTRFIVREPVLSEMSNLAMSHVICGRLRTFAAINRILAGHMNSKTGLWTTEVYWRKDGLKN